MDFKFKLGEQEEKQALYLGLATEYEAKPRGNTDKVEIWYKQDGFDRYSIYTKDVVEDKLQKGIWIKI